MSAPSVILSTGGTRHREGGLLQRQTGVRRRAGQRSGAGGYVGRSGRRRRQDRRRQILRLRHGLLQRAGHGGRSTRCATGFWRCCKQHKAYLCNDAADGRARQAADHAQLDGESALRGAGAHQDRADGGLRSAAGHLHHLLRNRRASARSTRSRPKSSRRCSRCYFVPDFDAGARHLFRAC